MASLVEELKLLELPAPSSISIEDLEHDLTAAKVVGREDFEGDELSDNVPIVRSSLRKNTAISLVQRDKRYTGQKISRKDLSKLRGNLDEDEENEEEEAASGLESGSEGHNDSETEVLLKENNELFESISDESGVEESEHSDQSENEVSGENEDNAEDGKEEEEEEEKMLKFSAPDVDELQKGKAVVNQIGLWDSLLGNRIRMQKSLVQINKLPQSDMFNDFEEKGGDQLKERLKNAQELLANLLHNLMVLQQMLFEQNTDTEGILDLEKANKTGQNDPDEDIPSDFEDENGDDEHGEERREEEEEEEEERREEGEEKKEDENELKDEPKDSLILSRKRKQSMTVEDYSANIAKRHAAFEPFRDATIKKWNEKTRLASGKVNNKSFSSFDRSTLTQIKQILSDRERLIKRTQLKRSSYRVLGKADDTENKEMEQRDAHLKDYDTEIFDDDDFYHQLLREFIERKSNVDPTDPIAMGRQWLEIQRLRSKVKRKVDTKASKGRRLRYDVHTKLVSFMAPQTKGTMPDSSRNELFSSLFGKRQPTETADIALFR